MFEEVVGSQQAAGLTEHYVRVTAAGRAAAGSIAAVEITGLTEDGLFGVVRRS